MHKTLVLSDLSSDLLSGPVFTPQILNPEPQEGADAVQIHNSRLSMSEWNRERQHESSTMSLTTHECERFIWIIISESRGSGLALIAQLPLLTLIQMQCKCILLSKDIVCRMDGSIITYLYTTEVLIFVWFSFCKAFLLTNAASIN